MAAVSWPAWLLTVVVGEAGVAATKSAEHTYMKNTVEKVFDESNIQVFFIENLLEAANEQLDNLVAALGKHEETKNYFEENNVNTILELNNGLVKIIAETNHRYTVSIDLEYKIIDTETQYVMNQETIKASGKRITLTSSSGSDEKEGVDTKLARQSLEVAYQKLANNIIESMLDLP